MRNRAAVSCLRSLTRRQPPLRVQRFVMCGFTVGVPMAKDKTKCRECQSRPIEYTTSITGATLKHGVCRDCYERRASRVPGNGGNFGRNGRTTEMKENTYETKYGTGHG